MARWNPDVQKEERKRRRKAPTMAQMQRGERWGSEHGMVGPRCAKRSEKKGEEEEDEGCQHGTTSQS